MTHRTWLQLIGLLGAVGVAAGAFGAHGLRDQITADRLTTWHTGVRYLMWHVVALLAVVVSQKDLQPWRWVLRCWLLGGSIFGGSLFALVLLDAGWLGAVTPAGGILLVSGWILLFRMALLNTEIDLE